MKSFMSEFKEFISRGNVMDMAVGIIIGGAFTAIVTSLVSNIIQPFITLITGGKGADVGGLVIYVNENASIDFGAFISAIINFLIIALVVFFLIKGVNTLQKAGQKLSGKEEEAEVEPLTCPFCLKEIKEGATRCPHCAGEFAEPAAAK